MIVSAFSLVVEYGGWRAASYRCPASLGNFRVCGQFAGWRNGEESVRVKKADMLPNPNESGKDFRFCNETLSVIFSLINRNSQIFNYACPRMSGTGSGQNLFSQRLECSV